MEVQPSSTAGLVDLGHGCRLTSISTETAIGSIRHISAYGTYGRNGIFWDHGRHCYRDCGGDAPGAPVQAAMKVGLGPEIMEVSATGQQASLSVAPAGETAGNPGRAVDEAVVLRSVKPSGCGYPTARMVPLLTLIPFWR